MSRRRWVLTLALAMAVVPLGCSHLQSRLDTETVMPQPNQAVDFDALYAQNCAACHGEHGQGGASIALASPLYLAIASDEVIKRTISNGVSGTPMPAFAESAGGLLTEQQISTLVEGIRDWSKPGELAGVEPPPYSAEKPGNAQRGAQVFRNFCSSCHGPGGQGGKSAGSVVDPSYLALVSNQDLRTVVIVGRPEFNAPDWQSDWPGHPMTNQDVTDVVAWLEAQRIAYPGQPYPSTGEGSKP